MSPAANSTEPAKVALVTGASSGIGAQFARRLGAGGYEVVLTARRRQRLEQVSAEIEQTGGRARVLVSDLATQEGIAAVAQAAGGAGVELVVHSAGFGGYRPFAEIDPPVIDDLITIHCIATARIARAALPPMIERGRGAIINISSLLAFSKSIPPAVLPHRATYAGCKAFMVTFTSQLAHELEGTGVKAMVCCPGLVETEFHGPDWQGPERMDADLVVTAAMKGLELGETLNVPGLEDASALDRLAEAEQQLLFGSGRSTEIAARYREP